MDAAIEIDDIVVANAGEAACMMPPVDVGNGEGLAFSGCTTVDDDFVDCSHCCSGLCSSYFER